MVRVDEAVTMAVSKDSGTKFCPQNGALPRFQDRVATAHAGRDRSRHWASNNQFRKLTHLLFQHRTVTGLSRAERQVAAVATMDVRTPMALVARHTVQIASDQTASQRTVHLCNIHNDTLQVECHTIRMEVWVVISNIRGILSRRSTRGQRLVQVPRIQARSTAQMIASKQQWA